jgi:hypothetical protein
MTEVNNSVEDYFVELDDIFQEDQNTEVIKLKEELDSVKTQYNDYINYLNEHYDSYIKHIETLAKQEVDKLKETIEILNIKNQNYKSKINTLTSRLTKSRKHEVTTKHYLTRSSIKSLNTEL